MTLVTWLRDYQELVDGAGLVELGSWTRIEVRGADRWRLLNTLATNRLDDLERDQGRETFLTDAKGRIVAHGIVVAEEESCAFITPAPRGDAIGAHLDRYIIREDVQVADQSLPTTMWYLGGRRAEAALDRLGIQVSQSEYAHAEKPIDSSRLQAVRAGIALGPAGFLLLADQDHARPIAAALETSGTRACVYEAFNSARIEAGWPLDAVDISADNFPQEVDRNEAAISFTKGCYLGQETVARIESIGHVNKQLVLLHFEAEHLAESVELSAEGKSVGRTTSWAYSPTFQCAVAIGYVHRDWVEVGAVLESPAGAAVVAEKSLIGRR